jgi:hypothetical protein
MSTYSFPCQSFESKNIQDFHTNKIILPDTLLVEWLFTEPDLLDGNKLIQLEITNPKTKLKTHCGVKEFKDETLIPKWIMYNLGLKENDPVDIKKTSLPIATSVTFQSKSKNFTRDVKNPEETLTANLSHNFSCLSVGDKIPIFDNDKLYILEVTALDPQNSVSLINPITMEMEAVLDIQPSQRQKQLFQYQKQQKALRGVYSKEDPYKELQDKLVALQKKYNFPKLQQDKQSLEKLISINKKRPNPIISNSIQTVKKRIQEAQQKIRNYQSNISLLQLKESIKSKYTNIHPKELQILLCVKPSPKEMEIYPDMIKWVQREMRLAAFNKK